MDNFTIHLTPLLRHFPHRFQVDTIGYAPRKDGWVCNTFHSVNFSFIFSGSGEYRHPLGTWRVEAPCVITQWPDVFVEYGPDKEWEELYLIYPRDREYDFKTQGLVQPNKPFWPIHDPGPTRQHLQQLTKSLQDPNPYGVADRIDRICENMVMESYIGEQIPETDKQTKAVISARIYLEEHLAEDIDFDELALEQGFSPSHFRRIWKEMMPLPPAQYASHLRIRQACRMLVETSLSIGEIALKLGFTDPLYFSRKFRQIMGQPATEYRSDHRWSLSLMEEEAKRRERDEKLKV